MAKKMMGLLAALLLGSGCNGQSGSANATPAPEVGVELTEPWKGMGFSLGGATVKLSDDESLIVVFPLAEREETGTIHRMLGQSLAEQGWSVEDDDESDASYYMWSYTKGDSRILITTKVRSGEVESYLRMRDVEP